MIDLILKHINIFKLFTQVYLFGSVIENEKEPNDIDLLLIYKVYSGFLKKEKSNIYQFLNNLFKLHIDIIILSEKELEETKFLEKLDSKYLKLK